jgi:drug/metabolite transporter (DMT)-like permease
MRKLHSEALLLLTAAIWGFAFVAQRQGMQYLDPLIFNGIRFTLGALCVGLLIKKNPQDKTHIPFPWLLGSVLFVAASLQQIGIVYTTAGSAGFITGLYVVFVPLIGIMLKQRLNKLIIISICLAVIGLYLINIRQPLSVSKGNLIILLSAVFWAWHVQLIDRWTRNYDTLMIAFYQCSFCALASLGAGIVYHLFKSPSALIGKQLYDSIGQASLAILYSGVLSVGIAYTLQVHAQKQVAPAPATIILCLEGAFALLGGWLLLKETITPYILLGVALLFAAMLISVLSKDYRS